MVEDAQASNALTQAPAEDKTPVFEVGFHLVPQVGEEGVTKTVEKIRKALGGAEIISESFPTKVHLAYVIERSVQGKREKYPESYFGWIKFATERGNIPALEEALRGMSDVLRYIIVETVRADVAATPRRAVFASDRLEGETIKRAPREAEKGGVVSEEELDKSIEALTG